MKITLTWFGHSAFCLDVGDDTILIDPFLTDNAFISTSAEEVDVDYILSITPCSTSFSRIPMRGLDV